VLLRAKANVNAADYTGATPLDYAVLMRRRHVIMVLRAAGGQQHLTDVQD